MIPKIIHQIWVGDQSKRPVDYMKTWQQKHPGWEYQVWDDECVKDMINRPQYEAIVEPNGKADILRFEILYKYGGVYVDADSVCLNPLDDFLLENDSFCCWENEYVRTGLMATGYIGATKGNQLMKCLVDGVTAMDPRQLAELPYHTAWQAVGPAYLTRTVQQLAYNRLCIYPSHYFIPKHYSGLEYQGKDKSYSMEYFLGTHVEGGHQGSYEQFGKDSD